MSTGGLAQPDVSPCTKRGLSVGQELHETRPRGQTERDAGFTQFLPFKHLCLEISLPSASITGNLIAKTPAPAPACQEDSQAELCLKTELNTAVYCPSGL